MSGLCTVKVRPSALQDTIASVAASHTRLYVFHRNGDTFMLSSELEPSPSAAGGAAAAAAAGPAWPAPRGGMTLARRGGPERAVSRSGGCAAPPLFVQ